MSQSKDDHNLQWEAWLIAKRAVSRPESFADGVMSAIERTAKSKASIANAASSRGAVSAQTASYLVASAAAVVCAVRVYGVVHVLLEPTPEYSVVSEESNPEVPNDKSDFSRS